MERPKPLRGEIWMFDLNPKKGHEQQGVRPCLIVSTDALNRSDFGTVIICPITTTERPRFKWRVRVEPGDLRLADTGWAPRLQWVETDQVVTVDTGYRALRHLATVVDEEKLRLVDQSLRMMLSL
jgi:mRNA-degrading endonuclease toxin of MazEF toxin-antitoxin module